MQKLSARFLSLSHSHTHTHTLTHFSLSLSLSETACCHVWILSQQIYECARRAWSVVCSNPSRGACQCAYARVRHFRFLFRSVFASLQGVGVELSSADFLPCFFQSMCLLMHEHELNTQASTPESFYIGLVYGLSMVVLFSVSSSYHLVRLQSLHKVHLFLTVVIKINCLSCLACVDPTQ